MLPLKEKESNLVTLSILKVKYSVKMTKTQENVHQELFELF